MAKLTAGQRKKLPASIFGLPGKRAYPMPNRTHAANAKSRASEELSAGNLTQSEHDAIVRKADRILYGP